MLAKDIMYNRPMKVLKIHVSFIVCFIMIAMPAMASTKPSTDVNCDRNPLYCAMLKLQPKVDRKWAMRFSNLLHRYAEKNDMDPWQSLAIAMQESSLRQIHRRENVIIENCSNEKSRQKNSQKGPECNLKYTKAITDMSVFQFHAQTILDYNMDIKKLHDDLEYAVKEHFKLLKTKMKNCPNEADLPDWTCYNSYHRAFRQRYYNLVKRYYVKPEEGKSKNSQ